MKKRIGDCFLLCLLLACLLSVTACGAPTNPKEESTQESTEESTQESTEESTQESTEESTQDPQDKPSVGLAYTVRADGVSCTVSGIGSCTDRVLCIPSQMDGYTVTAIAETAFAYCAGITEVIVPDTVTEIGSGAFLHCEKLVAVTLPQSLTRVGGGIFEACDALRAVYYAGTLEAWCGIEFGGANVIPFVQNPAIELSVNGTLISAQTEITVPDSITEIGSYTFYGFPNLQKVSLPSTLTGIGDSAFAHCSSLARIDIPDGVTRIGRSAFQSCKGLLSVKLPAGLTEWGMLTFAECHKLSRVTLPEGIATVPTGAFLSCTGLTDIELPRSVTAIEASAFAGCTRLEQIEIPEGVTQIPNYAFRGCSALLRITLPSSITNLGDSAFADCPKITAFFYDGTIGKWMAEVKKQGSWNENTTAYSVYCIDGTIPFSGLENYSLEGVTGICEEAFARSQTLIGVEIPVTVTTIGTRAFTYCLQLRFIFYEGTKAQWQAINKADAWAADCGNFTIHCIDGDLFNEERETLMGIALSVPTVRERAFEGFTALKEITITKGVTRIESRAFANCTALLRILYDGTVAEWQAIEKAENWDEGSGAYTVFCLDGEISK